jgi:hypothetical protein
MLQTFGQANTSGSKTKMKVFWAELLFTLFCQIWTRSKCLINHHQPGKYYQITHHYQLLHQCCYTVIGNGPHNQRFSGRFSNAYYCDSPPPPSPKNTNSDITPWFSKIWEPGLVYNLCYITKMKSRSTGSRKMTYTLYHSNLVALAQIILFLEMLKFSEFFFSQRKKSFGAVPRKNLLDYSVIFWNILFFKMKYFIN